MKIYFTTHNINKATLLKGIEEVKKHQDKINLNFEFIHLGETNVDFSIKYLNTNQRILNSEEIFKEAKKKGYVFGETNVIMHVYNWSKYNPQPTNPAQEGLVMQMPEQFYGNFPEVFADFFYHEIDHFYFQKTSKPDITHNYHPDFSQKPRIDWYLYLLKDLHLLIKDKPLLPTVTLRREYGDNNQQLGSLFTEGFSCKTMERAWKNNIKNISCIPKGEYECKWTFSPRFMKYTYEVLNVPNRTGIRFHGANYFFSLQGCIALGTHYGDMNKDSSADIYNSQITIDKFNLIMGKKPFILNIV